MYVCSFNSIQNANHEVDSLREELADTNKRLSHMSTDSSPTTPDNDQDNKGKKEDWLALPPFLFPFALSPFPFPHFFFPLPIPHPGCKLLHCMF